MAQVALDGASLSLDDVVAVARGSATVVVQESAWAGVDASRRVVDGLVERGEVAYGITTGFGEFAHVTIDRDQVQQLQRNLIMSHAVGVGEPLSAEVVRAMIVIRANTLLKGASGVRRIVVQQLLGLLKNGIVPVVPSRGSVGSSGDLAPLSHIALALIGMGEVDHDGTRVPAATALQAAGMQPLVLEAKEGLALINGTQMMAAIGCLMVHDAQGLLHDATAVAAASLEALMGSINPFDARVHELRPHPGQARVAANVRALCEGSDIIHSHAGCDRVQDAYSMRCIPQVLGAVQDAIDRTAEVLAREINSATDNPLVFADGTIVSQGNFHGEPLALIFDHLATAMAELANISERRIERMVNPDLSEGLKPFLVDRGGLNSGFMIAQYTAAALVSENKILCHPASVDSIPTSANQEDHNSMGSISALKLMPIIQNARTVVAIEALCAAQAIDYKAPLTPGKGSAAVHKAVRSVVARLEEDRVLAPDVAAMTDALAGGVVREAVSQAGIRLV